jgi:hypothetical protein
MKDDIIRMAREAGYGEAMSDLHAPALERLVELARAAEREKSLQLWMLLDDVDTADDIAKADDAIYRSLCRQAHQRRWHVLTGEEVDTAIRARGDDAA